MAEVGVGGALPAADAYRLWAPLYDRETAVSLLEDRLVRRLGPEPSGRALVDVGCGTGRRLPAGEAGAGRTVGVDLVPAMLACGRGAPPGEPRHLVAGDVLRLPLLSDVFDVVWCRLVLGHVADAAAAYRELARVARPGAALIVTDFHERAVAAGHRRTFRDTSGAVREVEHHIRGREAHRAAAEAVGWILVDASEAAAGEEERGLYAAAGRLDQLEAERDLPLVLALRFERSGSR